MADEVREPGGTDDTVSLDAAPEPSRRGRAIALWGVLAAVAVAAGAVAIAGGGDDDGRLPIALSDAATRGAAGEESAAMSTDMAWAPVIYVAGDDLPDLGGSGPAYRIDGAVSEEQVRDLAAVFGLEGEPRHEELSWALETPDGSIYVYEGGGGSWSYSSTPPMPEGGGGGSAGSCPADLPPEEAERCAAADGAGAAIVDDSAASSMSVTTHAVDTPVSDVDCKPDSPCTEPGLAPAPITPPEDLPSQDEARQIALDLLAETGTDVDGATVTVDGPYEAWYVNVEPTIDGLSVAGMAASVAVGSKGEILYASGYLVEPERLDDYPLVTTREAIDRLNEQMGGWFAYTVTDDGDVIVNEGGEVLEEEPLAVETGASTTTTTFVPPPTDGGAGSSGTTGGSTCASEPPVAIEESDTTTGGGDDPITTTTSAPPADTPAVDTPAIAVDPCSPTEPYVPPEPIEVVLQTAERSLLLVPAFDGSNDTYLVPAYRFDYEAEDGTPTWVDGIAIAEDALAPVVTTTPVCTTIPTGGVREPAE